jgi:hypothetical protein
MFIALIIVTVLLAAACVSSASMKLRQLEQAVAIIGGTVGVPLRFFPVLAMPLPPLVLSIAVLVLRLLNA